MNATAAVETSRRGRRGPPRAEKVAAVEEIRTRLSEAKAVVFVHIKGLPADETFALRRAFREKGVAFRVYKNRLLRRALSEAAPGVLAAMPGAVFEGETGVAFSADEVAPAQVVEEARKKNERPAFKIGLARNADGSFRVVPAEELRALAALPSREEILAKLLGLLNGPARAVLGVLSAPAGQVVRLLEAHRKALEEKTGTG